MLRLEMGIKNIQDIFQRKMVERLEKIDQNIKDQNLFKDDFEFLNRLLEEIKPTINL